MGGRVRNLLIPFILQLEMKRSDCVQTHGSHGREETTETIETTTVTKVKSVLRVKHGDSFKASLISYSIPSRRTQG